ncbi:hypothetical protein NIES4102_41390 (plasmid) [Chondrocystis sp. NIES-4102]|nr:hypothetical protein NIES4102_41390 [Chondrocystis sp. NIES-4102]
MNTNLDSIKKPIKRTKAYKAISKNLNYRPCKGYPSTQNIAVNLAAQVMIAEQYLEGKLPKDLAHTAESTPTKIFLYAAKCASRELVPCYWLASELAESLIETDIPDNWTGLKPFINRGFLLLPQNCIEYSGFGETESIDWLYFDIRTDKSLLESSIDNDKPEIIWTSGSDRLSVFYGTINLIDSKLGNASLSEKDRKIVEQVNKLLLNTMLVLNYKPELLDKPTSESKGIGFSNAGKLPSNFSRNPVWIGKVYSEERTGRHQSNRLIREPREHYRRGHWARRRHGNREKWQYKWHWIEPTTVNQLKS